MVRIRRPHLPEHHDSGAVEGVEGERGAAAARAVELRAGAEEVVGRDELEAARAVQPAEGIRQRHHPARVLTKRKCSQQTVMIRNKSS